MGTVTHHGWSTSEDDIPQPTSIIMGENLRGLPRLEDDLVAFMRKCGIEVTRENYIELAYCGEIPDPWPAELEANLPAELQDWAQFHRAPGGAAQIPAAAPSRAERVPLTQASPPTRRPEQCGLDTGPGQGLPPGEGSDLTCSGFGWSPAQSGGHPRCR